MGSRILSFIGLFILSAFPAWSQTGEWKDEYSRFTDLTPWVRSSNPAGIATLPVDKTSTVRASLEKKNGGLMDLHESRDCFRPSLDAASYMRISDRITFYGRMNYSYFKGKDMGGQILMDPYYNPINFLESVDTTTGTKTLEEYTLEGAMAYSLNDRLTLAGKVSYQSADYAKRKDPRSYNQWMDLDASVGARYSLADGKTAFGVSLNYVKTVETVAEKLFGTIDRQYYYLIDYGSYPFYRKQRIARNTVNLTGVKNFPMGNNFLSITLGGDYSFAGDDLKNEDGQYSSATGNPRTNDTYLNRNFEYFHASSAGGTASVRFTLVKETGRRHYSVFMDLADSYHRLTSDPEYLTGNYRNTIIFTIGCNF